MPAPQKCSRCDGKLDTDSKDKWCKKCRATYQREYTKTLESRAESKGFARGLRTCRELLIGRVGRGAITGHAAAQLIETEAAGSEPAEVAQRRGLVRMVSRS